MRVGVVGLGHIGGSIALAVEDAVGHDTDPEVVALAQVAGIDTVSPVHEADIVVVATPLAHLHDDLVPVLEQIGLNGATVTDVASVKGPVLAAAAGHPSFVSGHPMAGTERSGWAAADPALFAGAPWLVLVADGADVRRVAMVCRLALLVGAHPVPIHPASHDRALATVSHLPHVLAAALTLQAHRDGRAQPGGCRSRPRPSRANARALPRRRGPEPVVHQRPRRLGPVSSPHDGPRRTSPHPDRPPGCRRGRRPRHRHRRRHLHRGGTRLSFASVPGWVMRRRSSTGRARPSGS
jgi:hypothetical protein